MSWTLSPVSGPYVWAFVVFNAVMFILEQYLEVRQLRKNNETSVPKELEGTVDEKDFTSSQNYQRDKRIFGFFHDWVTFIWNQVGLFFFTPACWKIAVGFVGAAAEYKCTLLWLFLLQWVDKPLTIPLTLYKNFVVEERHNFNKMTMQTFWSDLVKGEALAYIFGGLLIPALIWIVTNSGDRFYLYLWAAVQFLILAMMWVYPNIIQPIFNKFEVLKDESLKAKIEALCADLSFPLTKLFQIDGSKRSSHSNAYFFGFWKYKRIVLYDTLLHLKHDDILAILCHELGHWKFGHTLTNLGITSVHLFALFWLFGTVMYSGELSKDIVRQFGFGDSDAVMVLLMLFMMLVTPTEQALQLAMTMLSRRFEFQADSFAVKMGRGEALQSGLFQIHTENKGDLNPDPWYSWYHFSHPPLVERVRALKAQQSATDKKSS